MTLMDVQEVAWDLDPLVDGDGAEGADRLLAEADERAARFAEAYAGRVGELDATELATAMAELETIVDRLGRAGNYAMLRFAVDTADPANGALLARVQEKGTAVETKLLFFELEWAAVDDERADELLTAEGLGNASSTRSSSTSPPASSTATATAAGACTTPSTRAVRARRCAPRRCRRGRPAAGPARSPASSCRPRSRR